MASWYDRFSNSIILAKILTYYLPHFRDCARWKLPAKYFKLCHILYIRKPKVAFSVFHFVLLYFFPYEWPGLCRHRPGHSLGKTNKVARNENWKKQLWVFVYIKYGKFWSVSPGHFIKHKPLISEECNISAYGHQWTIFKMAENDAGNLLVVILDTNPCQPSFLGKDPAKFTQWINSSLAFLNLHLSLNQTNEVALLSSGLWHTQIIFRIIFLIL